MVLLSYISHYPDYFGPELVQDDEPYVTRRVAVVARILSLNFSARGSFNTLTSGRTPRCLHLLVIFVDRCPYTRDY